MDFTENQTLIKNTIKEFAEKNIKPYIMQFDESQEFPMEIMRQLGELGFMGILFPEEYDGAGLGYVEYALIVEELAKVDPSISLSVAAHNGLCTNHIYQYANNEQKKKYLPDLATGKKIGAWGLTESSSGSDAASLKSIAVKSGGKYILNGSKTFITHGTVGEIAVVMAITDKEKDKKGISAFILEKGMKGFIAGKKENKLGMRASDTTQLIFDNCEIPDENLLGNEGEGFSQAMIILEGGRISIAALSVGLAQGCLDACTKYSKERKQFGKSLSEFQATQFKLSQMATNIEAARLLTYRAAAMKDQGKPNTKEAAMAKLFASEIAEKCANDAVQIFGGYGYMKDYPVEKFYRDVKLLTIGEGTSEIQRIVIARDYLK
ncbi:MAG: acyl-CoA dehydrogenase [Ignavibacteria bacterium RIFOXYB2_FULL_35_12]|nr:MAG: acyl-CoA dehydrogenase [Ignavibacteria bacterium GWA2_36_19]OGU49028.1 MAG: acyl-CoA dehydrogenase [Ignavibacteria bacterium GWC2_35_8]OGU59798.1 MAG: acyl-CoA dehydrogenase [Ignavibacteria bacterium GWF2_35_20]OGU80664.1 MAG: acyl-CoA dehydrogenase [Ignavibacteria bacterium RIFOXYA2_FULL_35_9]OGU85264.1 MAG: acyl-CoA dehydrogenase [Ignavibacteria bacterium RIFOXYA12_FULL_35_25]OGU91853.1 MAG: acyl-CoA dehydrogenase [Ignavibacteria bacterium RIFOXYC12_FULL_35_11]OGU97512.1 MAG: acyl-C